MWVIIQRIPLSTTQRELNLFINKQLDSRGWFGLAFNQKTTLKSFSILKMTDRLTGSIECHGLAELDTTTPEEDTLKALNGHQLHGKTVAVRKYYHRSSTRPQDLSSSHNDGLIAELQERRRPNLYIEMLKSNFGRFSTGLF